MKSRSQWIVGFSLLLLALIRVDAQTSDAELRLGVAEYKNSRYEAAVQHFQKAIELAPDNLTARIYLATAYVSQYIPGIDTPDNVAVGEHAVEQYQAVLNSSENREQRINSSKGIAYLYLNMNKFVEAKKYYEMASDLDAKDPEPHYSIGVIDWTECYQPRMEARARLGVKPGEQLDAKDKDQKKVCDELRLNNMPSIEEGMDQLHRAMELRPGYDDAMAYMNLMYRERADVECEDPAARAEDLKTADDWVDKTLATKKARAEKAAPAPEQQ
jgi:tetratricopeptide (TPR) repeat protein